MKNTIVAAVAGLCLMFQCGCAVILLGGGAVAGYSMSKDSIEGYSDHSYDKVWAKTIEIVKQNGVITSEDKEHGKFEGVVREVTVKGELTRVSNKTVKLKISGRKGIMPRADVPQDLYTKIIEKLATSK